jgi:hypothetical protein
MVRALVFASILCAVSAHAQSPTSIRAGRRTLLPRTEEVALARSAAPPNVSAKARVLVLSDTGYVVADPGAGENGVTCIVDRSWRDSMEPHCFDAEAATTIMPMEMLRTTWRHLGRAEADIDREVADRLASGKFRLPARPAMTYMLSGAQVLYNDEGKYVGRWRPHVMIFYPYLTNEAVGLASPPDIRGAILNEPGTPMANLMVIVPQFIELGTKGK